MSRLKVTALEINKESIENKIIYNNKVQIILHESGEKLEFSSLTYEIKVLTN
jgi:rRNA pseudouridine-1189 N-methylase Emg1 (Nep1/Mra1 family)